VNDVPSDLEALCLDLMAIDPARRPSDESIIARLSVPGDLHSVPFQAARYVGTWQQQFEPQVSL
jgi:hypothetical protein